MDKAERRVPISGVVITFNEAENLRECLESLDWVDELVVVDSFSTDRTVEIARELTPKVYQRPWAGFVAQKNDACSLAEHDWVFSVDADERVTPELRDEIIGLLAKPEGLAEGYKVSRRTFYLGRWIRHGGWYPDKTVRLFRRSRGRFEGQDLHERVHVDGPVGQCDHELVHFNYPNLSAQLATVDRYSSLAAKTLRDQGRSFSLPGLLFKPPLKFLETYLWKLGCLDGMPGLIIAGMTSYYAFLKQAKLWELQKVSPGRPRVAEPKKKYAIQGSP